MSSKSSKKVTKIAKLEPIVTRTKSAQQKLQLRNKDKKTEKPKLTKSHQKSPKKNVTCSKDTLLKSPEKNPVVLIEQVEYYPNKLKRNIPAKKIMLKHKHNFKVVAATNKRKLAVPQKGKSPLPSKKQRTGRSLLRSPIRSKPCNSPELSVEDMVRIMEETRSLSDEDFMEILTCPSPVWWEDPPDGRYDEDSIYTRSPEPPEPVIKITNKRKITKNTSSTNINNNITNIEKIKATENKKDEGFFKKKQKLENILGNIKNKTVKTKIENKSKTNELNRKRKISDSEGDISDLSFNEEEILNTLENMDIPIENTENEQNTDLVDIKKENETDDVKIIEETTTKKENELKIKKEKDDLDILPLLENTFEITDEFPTKSSIFREMNSNMDSKCDEIITVDSANSSLDPLLEEDFSFNTETVNKKSKEQNNDGNIASNPNDLLPNKKIINDMSEYITVYKIIPENNIYEENIQENDTKNNENKTKIDAARGKLNNFFKHCKSNKRLKKNENSIPANSVADAKVKEEATDNKKEISEEKIDGENRLKPCDYCVVKTVNGKTDFSCEKCEFEPTLACTLCNFVAETKEVYRKHISSCKEVTRIPWSHNYVLNQT